MYVNLYLKTKTRGVEGGGEGRMQLSDKQIYLGWVFWFSYVYALQTILGYNSAIL